MIDAHLLSWTGVRAESRLRTYRSVLTVSLVVDVLLGLFALFNPGAIAGLLDQPLPHPEAWLRAWGAMMIGVSIFWVSGRGNPAFHRWPNWSGIAIKILLALVFAFGGRGFALLAGWEALSGLSLAILYYRFLMAEMGRRP